MASKNRVTVNLSDDEADALAALADKSNVSKAWLGRHAIRTLIDSAKRDEIQLPLPLAGKRR